MGIRQDILQLPLQCQYMAYIVLTDTAHKHPLDSMDSENQSFKYHILSRFKAEMKFKRPW
jgi:hypothetical protein